MPNLVLIILFIVLSFALLVTHAVMLVLEWRERMRQERREQEGKTTEGGPRA